MVKAITKIESDRTYEDWNEYHVIEKAWQIYLLNGERYVKKDFKGYFFDMNTGRVKSIAELFPRIRNCTDSQGYIIAKRKKYGEPLREEKYKHHKVPRR